MDSFCRVITDLKHTRIYLYYEEMEATVEKTNSNSYNLETYLMLLHSKGFFAYFFEKLTPTHCNFKLKTHKDVDLISRILNGSTKIISC